MADAEINNLYNRNDAQNLVARLISLNKSTNEIVKDSMFGPIYELDQIDENPSINDTSMGIIAQTVWKAYDEQLRKKVNANNTNEKVYTFCDTNYDGKFEKITAVQGEYNNLTDSAVLEKNDRLMFNLSFDENGSTIIPKKLYIISHHIESAGWLLKESGFIGFEIDLTRDIINNLENVKLKTLARKKMAVENNDFKSVSVKIPFLLSKKIISSQYVRGYMGKSLKRVHLSNKNSDALCKLIKENIKGEVHKFENTKNPLFFNAHYSNVEYKIDFRVQGSRHTMESMIEAKSFSTELISVKFSDSKSKEQSIFK